MPTRHHAQAAALALALPLLLAECKSATGECNPTDPLCGTPDRVPTTVVLSPTSLSLSGVGQTGQLSASVRDQDDQPINSPSIVWTSDDESVATVSNTGLVTAAGPGGTTVEATAGSASASAAVSVGDPCDPLGTLTFGESRAGSLSATDCTLQGYHVDSWILSVPAGDAGQFQIDLISADFDTYVGLLDDQSNIVAENDDAHSTGSQSYDQSAHVAATLAAGTYTIAATSFSAGSTGAYHLYVGPGLNCPEQAVIARASSTSGATLAATDCQYDFDAQTYNADMYVLQVTTAGTVTIDLTSTEFDTYLTLFDPSGNFIDDDDDRDTTTTDSRIQRSLAAGWYVIEASSFAGGEEGTYTLSVD